VSGLVARLKQPLLQRCDFAGVLVDAWVTLSAREMADRPVVLQRDGRARLGDIFDLTGEPRGAIRFVGDLGQVDRLGAGLREGAVVVEGNAGEELGIGMAAGALIVRGSVGARAGAGPLGHKKGMTGGELIVHGSAGPEAGADMRRGLLAIGGAAGPRAGLRMIAGTVVVFGEAGEDAGLWSKRGSVVALGLITPPSTYVYACTFQPIYLRPLLSRLRDSYDLPVKRRHLIGSYRRYSGDIAELGKGEILQWTAA
jgi:formylmethanofuran dehydrogenase subunit C